VPADFLRDHPKFRQKLLSEYGQSKNHQTALQERFLGIAVAYPPEVVAAGSMFDCAVYYWFCGNRGYDKQLLRRRFKDEAVKAEVYLTFLA